MTVVDWGDRVVALETSGGVLTARAVIMTASTAVLASGKVKFKPNLPAPYSRAIEKLKLGSYDHVAIEFNGNPFGLETNEIVFEKVTGDGTPAAFSLTYTEHGCLSSLYPVRWEPSLQKRARAQRRISRLIGFQVFFTQT